MVLLDDKIFLRGSEIAKEGTEITFVDEGWKLPEEERQAPEKDFSITVKLPNAEERVWTPNKTSRIAVITLLGRDPAKWKGKKITVYSVEGTFENKQCFTIKVKMT